MTTTITVQSAADGSPVISAKESHGFFDLHNLTRRLCTVRSQLAREFIGEVISTFILVAFGCASVAQYLFVESSVKIPFLSVNFGFGIGVTLGALVAGKISGAHMNPAVSLSMLLTGRMSLVRFFIYMIGQCVGAFMGSVVVYLVYLDAIIKHGERTGLAYDQATAGIFATYPVRGLSPLAGLCDQLVGTALLIIVILAITDRRNADLPAGTGAILAGMTVFVIGTSFGHNCGYAVNPARDFMPRLFTAIAGWGGNPFVWGDNFFWIPIVGPFLGSVVGTLVYVTLVSTNWP